MGSSWDSVEMRGLDGGGYYLDRGAVHLANDLHKV
jgi:hypothetical protein